MRTERKVIEPLKYQHDISCSFVLVVLNHDDATDDSLHAFKEQWMHLWDKAVFRVCVDGGTNLIHQLNKRLVSEGEKRLVPDLISGDFDSVDIPLLDEFEAQGSQIIPTPDQDHTDFTKCLMILNDKFLNGDIEAGANIVVTIPECTQRFDHAMANVNTLHKAKSMLSGGNDICLVSNTTLQCVVPEGETDIKLNGTLLNKPFLLMPVHKPAVVSTVGLENEQEDNRTDFSCPYSSFQCFPKASLIQITTSASLLLAVNIKS